MSINLLNPKDKNKIKDVKDLAKTRCPTIWISKIIEEFISELKGRKPANKKEYASLAAPFYKHILPPFILEYGTDFNLKNRIERLDFILNNIKNARPELYINVLKFLSRFKFIVSCCSNDLSDFVEKNIEYLLNGQRPLFISMPKDTATIDFDNIMNDIIEKLDHYEIKECALVVDPIWLSWNSIVYLKNQVSVLCVSRLTEIISTVAIVTEAQFNTLAKFSGSCRQEWAPTHFDLYDDILTETKHYSIRCGESRWF